MYGKNNKWLSATQVDEWQKLQTLSHIKRSTGIHGMQYAVLKHPSVTAILLLIIYS